MSKMLDRFSDVAVEYARYRPNYPESLYEFLYSLLDGRHCAWDAGTGNGQVAAVLSESFTQVIATDISSTQIAQATQTRNVQYRVCPAEESEIASTSVDLITVAQAAHWFRMNSFTEEVRRVGAIDSVLAIWGYSLFTSEPEIDTIIRYFYTHILDGYWDPHRAMADRRYQDFQFPFKEIACPEFAIEKTWNAEDILGYLGTWSAVNSFRRSHHKDPRDKIKDALVHAIEGKSVTCRTSVFMRAWHIV